MAFKRLIDDEHMTATANILEKCLPDNIGFTLLLFDKNEGRDIQYVGNAEPLGMAKAMRQAADQLEAMERSKP